MAQVAIGRLQIVIDLLKHVMNGFFPKASSEYELIGYYVAKYRIATYR